MDIETQVEHVLQEEEAERMNKAKVCRLFHNFTGWSDPYEVKPAAFVAMTVRAYNKQRRNCKRCGRVEERLVGLN